MARIHTGSKHNISEAIPATGVHHFNALSFICSAHIEEKADLIYLGVSIYNKEDCKSEVTKRIAMFKTTLSSLKNSWDYRTSENK